MGGDDGGHEKGERLVKRRPWGGARGGGGQRRMRKRGRNVKLHR